ncbi:ester cyclase [Peribacillus muralis]|uniref:nuclear transport factor 2 family protein n=1 Tax=Peribacillus muralis TaxID=264697 RepID=UPI001F4E8624|nr:ester cyclase [Peribacillus muralis]MCK1992251.1 ester cyclase [Peribacillus muralis]MCK2012807.1 ester cyclase [Peribacillus muralis]
MTKVDDSKVMEKKESLDFNTTQNNHIVLHDKVFYGDNAEVNRLGYADYNEFSKNTIRKQSMRGFDSTYVDIVDYIVKCTHRIWEENGFGLIYSHYHNESILHAGSLNYYGINHVLSSSIQMQHSFPDRKVVGEQVIWSVNDQDAFYTSHRSLSLGTNLGATSFGPATRKRASFRVIADCVVHSNRIVEEWLVRDYLHIVKQLGYNPVEIAKKLARTSQKQSSFGRPEAMEGQFMPEVYTKKHESFEIGDFVLEMYNKIWEQRLFNHVKDYYADHAVVHYICDQDIVGHNKIQGLLVSLFASFPTAKVILERVTCNQGERNKEWDVAVRWRLQGMHEGIGTFGLPSGKPIEILGITHLKVRNEKIVEEWIVFDGIDVLRQTFLDTEDETI